MKDSIVVFNNLGGQGPYTTDPEIILYENVGNLNGKQVDLHVAK